MKVLYSWLKEYVDIDITPQELEEKLFSVGFEVEGVEYLGKDLEKVVVGQVTSMEHYEGTHLEICHVNCGEHGEDHLILTGADNVFVGANVAFTNDKYPRSKEYGHTLPTLIKRGATIGAGCTILCGITIGENAMIGAGSVVTKDIPAGELWVGNPAKFVRKIDC